MTLPEDSPIKVLTALIALFLVTSLISCCIGPNDDIESGKISVVVSILPLSEFVENVGGDRVDVKVLVPPGAEVHTFDPPPPQLRDIADAKIFVKNGAGLEIWENKIIETNREILVVDASEGVKLMEMEEYEDEDHSDGYEEKQHNGKDPHIWLSPKNAKIMVENICYGLINVDPENSSYYITNRDSYLHELDQLDNNLSESFSGLENKRFIVLHPAWGYFAKDYGLEQIVIEFEGKEPSIEYITKVIEIAKDNNIKVVFSEPQFNPETAEMIANEIGGVVILIDPLAKDYTENLKGVAREIVNSGAV